MTLPGCYLLNLFRSNMLFQSPLRSSTVIAPVFIHSCNFYVHNTDKRSNMEGEYLVLAEYMSSSNDMDICGNDPLYLVTPFAGIFTVRPNKSSSMKCSLVLCQFTQASGGKYSRIALASCRKTTSQNSFMSILIVCENNCSFNLIAPLLYASDHHFFCNISLSILTRRTLFRSVFISLRCCIRFAFTLLNPL